LTFSIIIFFDDVEYKSTVHVNCPVFIGMGIAQLVRAWC